MSSTRVVSLLEAQLILGYAIIGDSSLTRDESFIDTSYSSNSGGYGAFGATILLILIVEDSIFGSQEFLKCPASTEPTESSSQTREIGLPALCGHKVKQIHITNNHIPVPIKHGVDRFGKFCRASLIDAAAVHPNPFETVPSCLLAKTH